MTDELVNRFEAQTDDRGRVALMRAFSTLSGDVPESVRVDVVQTDGGREIRLCPA